MGPWRSLRRSTWVSVCYYILMCIRTAWIMPLWYFGSWHHSHVFLQETPPAAVVAYNDDDEDDEEAEDMEAFEQSGMLEQVDKVGRLHVCACVCVCAYVCVLACAPVCMCMLVCVSVCALMSVWLCACLWVLACVHECICTCLCVCGRVCMCMCILFVSSANKTIKAGWWVGIWAIENSFFKDNMFLDNMLKSLIPKLYHTFKKEKMVFIQRDKAKWIE